MEGIVNRAQACGIITRLTLSSFFLHAAHGLDRPGADGIHGGGGKRSLHTVALPRRGRGKGPVPRAVALSIQSLNVFLGAHPPSARLFTLVSATVRAIGNLLTQPR